MAVRAQGLILWIGSVVRAKGLIRGVAACCCGWLDWVADVIGVEGGCKMACIAAFE